VAGFKQRESSEIGGGGTSAKREQVCLAAHHILKVHEFFVTRVEEVLEEAEELAKRAGHTRNPEGRAALYRTAYFMLRRVLLECKNYADYHILKAIQALERSAKVSFMAPSGEDFAPASEAVD